MLRDERMVCLTPIAVSVEKGSTNIQTNMIPFNAVGWNATNEAF